MLNQPVDLIFNKSVKGRRGYVNPPVGVDAHAPIPQAFMRKSECNWPEVSELDVVRHFTLLSRLNYSVDTNFYPLGSCTMKYNPRITEKIAQLSGFTDLHPLLPQLLQGEKFTQGALQVLFEMEEWLCEITGMKAFTLQPLAGAHGELAGVMMIAAYHRAKGNKKKYIIVPDAAHGTNPATASIVGYEILSVKTTPQGILDLDDLKSKVNNDVAGLMLTCPDTHGIFHSDIDKIAEIIHAVDGLMYYDGANLNAILGRCRPGDVGFDVMHINIHKTFSAPHGGGGPGSGPVGVSDRLLPFLPISRVIKRADGSFALNYDYPQSVGYISSFYGNFSVLLKAFAYTLILGGDGLKQTSDHAVLNANYIRACLKDYYTVPYDRICMHEVVFSAEKQVARGVHAIDVAKFLIDKGYHPPTVYFPMTVKEAIMVEPTETESKQSIDEFIQVMIKADELSKTAPESFHDMPKTMPISRPDEVKAAKDINTCYRG
ncbi:MAG: aminomethyl-transferring glycine dehydrogenase subunit GcvPB [Candidatus Omnitrophica bacterium]|nr:aminomethyl-transferring glycine dehydrogenase subunit GcvPB [Candidatus Omnitrophota bacterium]